MLPDGEVAKPVVKVPVLFDCRCHSLYDVVGYFVLDGPRAKILEPLLAIGRMKLVVTSRLPNGQDDVAALVAINIAPGIPATPELVKMTEGA